MSYAARNGGRRGRGATKGTERALLGSTSAVRVVIAPDSGTANGVTKSKAGPRSQRELTVCSERPTRCARPPRGRMRKSSGLSSPYTLPPAARSISSAWYPVLALCAHGATALPAPASTPVLVPSTTPPRPEDPDKPFEDAHELRSRHEVARDAHARARSLLDSPEDAIEPSTADDDDDDGTSMMRWGDRTGRRLGIVLCAGAVEHPDRPVLRSHGGAGASLPSSHRADASLTARTRRSSTRWHKTHITSISSCSLCP